MFLLLCIVLSAAISGCTGGSYSEKKAIHDTLLADSNYNVDIRPVLNQSDVLIVQMDFELIAIKEIDDVVQKVECNGFLSIMWYDQLLTWNTSDYGGEEQITPKPEHVWRPRIVLLNTMGERDLYEDDYAPLNVRYDGLTIWIPGAIIPASCNMDLTKYPFDTQTCEIWWVIMNYDTSELQFSALSTTASLRAFTRNGAWEITSTELTSPDTSNGSKNLSSIRVVLHLKRRSQFLVLSTLLPIVFLSLLNLFVFLIPVNSGEKIAYGITVLLALTVFMSIMSEMLPNSSESMPLVITYILILLIISMLTVVDAIIIVMLHHMEEKEEKSQKTRTRFKAGFTNIKLLRRSVLPMPGPNKEDQLTKTELTLCQEADKTKEVLDEKRNFETVEKKCSENINHYKIIGQYIDQISLLVFGLMWTFVTMGFMIAMIT